jgi:3-deoxy-manno-octulosonate cytidylyltransferase (CMP-KDO synthetase)
MLAWVFDAARACPQLDDLLIATDSDEIAELCRAHGWPCAMTSPELQSGSDRVFAVSQSYPAEIYVNIQGDEPLLRPEHISALLQPFERPEVQVTTLKVPCSADDITNPNAVKVVTAPDSRALYFSRATIPFDRDQIYPALWKHQGFYAYRASALARFHALAPSPLERIERLEQLRFLENGIPVHVAATTFDTIGVDTEDDLRRVEQILLSR